MEGRPGVTVRPQTLAEQVRVVERLLGCSSPESLSRDDLSAIAELAEEVLRLTARH